ncbi:LRR receptor-like serine threonine-protein kinase [Seminavis robusta]|uniref:LRR receptor-like serine threonine-protein kinase n=1 Tax=Seminavis robusta TaxID=568900 RepID=A0A9N8DMU8_9STRA|nr:LRR receptor-like serine threonine-protein kinase [Seminavis robusta]|eukprot:Sro249_g098590.1 LRR receptor-like serine threonine-protein kinase (607) ;mRNA; f:14154-16076
MEDQAETEFDFEVEELQQFVGGRGTTTADDPEEDGHESLGAIRAAMTRGFSSTRRASSRALGGSSHHDRRSSLGRSSSGMGNSSHTDRYRRHATAPARSSSSSVKLWQARGSIVADNVDQSTNLMSASYHTKKVGNSGGGGGHWGDRSWTDIFLERDHSGSGSMEDSFASVRYGETKVREKVKIKKWPVFLVFLITGLALTILLLVIPMGGVILNSSSNSSASSESTNDHTAQVTPSPETNNPPTPSEPATEEEEEEPAEKEQAKEEVEPLEDDAERLQALESLFMDLDITPKSELQKEGSAANKALRWIATEDTAKIVPNTDNKEVLVQRYALAVFFFSQQQHENDDVGTTAAKRAGVGGRRLKSLEPQQRRRMENTDRTVLDKTWLTEGSICQWHGIFCDGDEKHLVHEIYLSRANLVGTIPEELFLAMPSLQRLDLTHNQFHGKLPSQLPSSLQLEHLLLGHNQLTGSVPRNILQELPTLKELVLVNNSLTGELPEATDSVNDNLQVLSLAANQLKGSIPKSYGQELPSLKKFNLDGNSGIRGSVPTELGLLSNLERLQLHGTSLTGEMPQQVCTLHQSSSLRYLVTDCTSGEIQCDCCTRCF